MIFWVTVYFSWHIFILKVQGTFYSSWYKFNWKQCEQYFIANITILSISLRDERKHLYWNHSCNLATYLVWLLNLRQSINPEKLTGSDYPHHHTDLSRKLYLPQVQARQKVQGFQLLLAHPVKNIASYKLLHITI